MQTLLFKVKKIFSKCSDCLRKKQGQNSHNFIFIFIQPHKEYMEWIFSPNVFLKQAVQHDSTGAGIFACANLQPTGIWGDS